MENLKKKMNDFLFLIQICRQKCPHSIFTPETRVGYFKLYPENSVGNRKLVWLILIIQKNVVFK